MEGSGKLDNEKRLQGKMHTHKGVKDTRAQDLLKSSGEMCNPDAVCYFWLMA